LDAPSPIVIDALLRLADRMDLATHLSAVCNLVISNLRTASGLRYLGGARVEHLHPLGPIFDGANLHIACLRDGASVDIGLTASRAHVPEPFDLAAALSDALAELVTAALEAGQQAASRLGDETQRDQAEASEHEQAGEDGGSLEGARIGEHEDDCESEKTSATQHASGLRLAP
jgi:hypothetical protein